MDAPDLAAGTILTHASAASHMLTFTDNANKDHHTHNKRRTVQPIFNSSGWLIKGDGTI